MAYAGVLSASGEKATAGYLDRARALVRRAEALGAELVSFSAVTLAFSWSIAATEKAVAFAIGAVRDRREGQEPWASGVAQGTMEPIGLESPPPRAELAWGPPLVEAVALARIAAPGEVLVHASVEGLEAGELLAMGSKISLDSGRRVRGARLDIHQPWRSASAAQIARLVEPPLVGRASELALLASAPGAVTILRADPGLGGSRMLAELAAKTAPSKTLLLTPLAVKAEPLGALRRAFIHLAGSEPLALEPELHAPLDRLLTGEGIALDTATQLVAGYLRNDGKGPPPALLIDDAIEIDGPSLEVAVRAAATSQIPWLIVVRVDALADLPSVFGSLRHGADVELRPMAAGDAGQIAELATRKALSPLGAARWARRGGFSPLGVIEAVTSGLATGELAWVGDAARARRRASGKGTPRPAAFWIAQRAEELSSEARAVLVAVALLGGSASLATLTAVARRMSSSIDIAAEMPRLLQARWLSRMKDGWLALPTRSHREAVLQLMNDAGSRSWHRAIAEEIEKAGGALQLAEAAQHAAKAGDGPWAARLATIAAQRATELGQDTAAMRLVAFARAQDPSSIDATSEVVETFEAISKVMSLPPPGPLSIPPPPSLVPIPPGVTRMRAMDDLSRGRATQAVRTLRIELDKLGDASTRERSKGALALGLALAHAGETDEALLAALDGLARAREGGDARGERACMMLVAKLLTPSETDAKRVREALEAKA
jgi:hypothetical protein